MALPETHQPMTEADYLAFERASELKHEFIDGELVAMSGASINHNLITMATSASLFMQTRGGSCRVFSSDMRVGIPNRGNYLYPDVVVVCGDLQRADDEFDTLLNPTLIIEVLSPSTERRDRGQKFQNYWQLPSLQSYVLIAQDQPRLECFTRKDEREWLLTVAVGLDEALDLPSIGCTLRLAEVYEQVTFDNPDDDTDAD